MIGMFILGVFIGVIAGWGMCCIFIATKDKDKEIGA